MDFVSFGADALYHLRFSYVVQLISAIFVISILLHATISIRLWSKVRFPSEQMRQTEELPPITIVLPTWNEEQVIKGKLDDIRAQEYPDELLEIIVIDAASTDSTVSIASDWISNIETTDAREYSIIREDARNGKSVSINTAFQAAREKSTILMMSDVDCRLSKGAIMAIAKRFGDPQIGAVTGRQILLNPGQSRKTHEEGRYRDFYSKLRIAESSLYSTPIFHGECAAYRRTAITGHKLVENSNADDSQMAVSVVRSGFRAVYDPSIEFFEMAPPDSNSSQIQKTRRAQGLVRHFWRNKDLAMVAGRGPFGKIMALEFSLHILLPIFVCLGFLSGFVHIGLVAIESELSINGLSELPTIDLALISTDVLVLALIISGALGLPIPASRLSYTFFSYMLTLMKAQSLIALGKSLHIWEQVPSVRTALRDHDYENKL